MAKKTNAPDTESERFSKRAILKAETYRHRADLLTALLDDTKIYTLEEVDRLMERHLKGQVK